jgi:hypothetical protein
LINKSKTLFGKDSLKNQVFLIMRNFFFLRLTDLCEYCEKEIVFKKKITKVLEDTFDNYQNETDILYLKNE